MHLLWMYGNISFPSPRWRTVPISKSDHPETTRCQHHCFLSTICTCEEQTFLFFTDIFLFFTDIFLLQINCRKNGQVAVYVGKTSQIKNIYIRNIYIAYISKGPSQELNMDHPETSPSVSHHSYLHIRRTHRMHARARKRFKRIGWNPSSFPSQENARTGKSKLCNFVTQNSTHKYDVRYI